MARKNLLLSVTGQGASQDVQEARSDYASRGASRSMMLSLEEMAENSKKLVLGEAIVSLDPNLIDSSFVSDRLEDDEEGFALLKEGIAKEGQLQPILVRPHPDQPGRYMVVFGHRRTRAALELGIPVQAIVKNLEAIAHIIFQGQENTRRANLTFIEKALFARKLTEMGQTKETIRSALSLDDTLLSRMASIVEVIPLEVINAIGAARSIGRDRWEELKKLLLVPKATELADQVISSTEFLSMEPTSRFNHLLEAVKTARKQNRKPAASTQTGGWSASDNLLAATFTNSGKVFSLSLKSKDASEFGQYISSNLEALYRAFKEAKTRNQGD